MASSGKARYLELVGARGYKMLARWNGCLSALVALVGCTTPYRPAVLVAGSAPFPGIASLIEQSTSKQVDVLMVHGMCTHTQEDARKSIDNLLAAMDANIQPEPPKKGLGPQDMGGIAVESKTATVGGASVRFSALVWSPLTTPLKKQLNYDDTGSPTDCSLAGECKPTRAKLNGSLNDGLLNDCLSDVLIYQGQSQLVIRQKLVKAITKVVEDSEASARATGMSLGPFVLVSESLGSKMSFDALKWLLDAPGATPEKAAGDSALDRLTLIFMLANQLPILGLAEQSIGTGARTLSTPESGYDSLQHLLQRKSRLESTPMYSKSTEPGAISTTKLTVVAFTDPNDLLSYRILPSLNAAPDIGVADVLVSNDSTYLGFLELPNRAHTDYRINPDVTRLIACGSIGSKLCK